MKLQGSIFPDFSTVKKFFSLSADKPHGTERMKNFCLKDGTSASGKYDPVGAFSGESHLQ